MVDSPSNKSPERKSPADQQYDQNSERPSKRARTRSRSPSSPRDGSGSGSPTRSRSPLPTKDSQEVKDNSTEPSTGSEPATKDDDKPPTSADDTPADDPPSSPEEGEFIPPLPEGPPPEDVEEGEFVPPLPEGPPPEQPPSDGWEAIWEPSVNAYYFHNAITGETTWTNPRVPDAHNPALDGHAAGQNGGEYVSEIGAAEAAAAAAAAAAAYAKPPREKYNPAIHGDYDPTAPYAQRSPSPDPAAGAYTTQTAFNGFTGRFQQNANLADSFGEENKAKRQMDYYFDVDAAANSHDGRSLKAERQNRKLTKAEVKAFRDKRREKKEEKRRAWLKD